MDIRLKYLVILADNGTLRLFLDVSQQLCYTTDTIWLLEFLYTYLRSGTYVSCNYVLRQDRYPVRKQLLRRSLQDARIVGEWSELNHNRAYYRHHRERVIRRKVNMLLAYGGKENVDAWTQGHSGRLSKGKIHCSCFMCRRKSFDHPQHRDEKWYLDAGQQNMDLWIREEAQEAY